MDKHKLLIQKYFEEKSFVEADLTSFNTFVDTELQTIIEENELYEVQLKE